MLRLLAISATAAAGVALATPPHARVSHLPGCHFAQGEHIRGTVRPRVDLRVASLPRALSSSRGVTWVLTVTNPTTRDRILAFADTAYAEIQLRRGRRTVYSLYRRDAHGQALWARTVAARSSWSCVSGDEDPVGVAPGRYTLVAFLRTTEGPQPRATRSVVVGP
jgi:hypothetical protein